MSKVVLLMTLVLFSCSPTSIDDSQCVPYCQLQGTVWYQLSQGNKLAEYIFYRDSVISWVYTYSPTDQQYKDYSYPKYTVISIRKYKIEITRKDVQYKDGDGYTILLQETKGYPVTENGAKIYDWSVYGAFFVISLTDSTMRMGVFDELEEVQAAYLCYKVPPIQLDFSNWE